MRVKWLLDGNWDGDNWNEIIEPNLFPNPKEEFTSGTTSTAGIVELLNGSEARITKPVKTRKTDLNYTISEISTEKERSLLLLSTPIDYKIRDIVQYLIDNDISIRLRYYEDDGSGWELEDTYCGYFKEIGKTYRNFALPQRYVVPINLKRIDVDATGTY